MCVCVFRERERHCVCVCVFVCGGERERARERERERERESEREREREREIIVIRGTLPLIVTDTVECFDRTVTTPSITPVFSTIALISFVMSTIENARPVATGSSSEGRVGEVEGVSE